MYVLLVCKYKRIPYLHVCRHHGHTVLYITCPVGRGGEGGLVCIGDNDNDDNDDNNSSSRITTGDNVRFCVTLAGWLAGWGPWARSGHGVDYR